MAKKKESISFETALSELETIVQRMEKGDLSLEESLSAFERGIQLTRNCQSALKDAEQKVNILVANGGETTPVPFDNRGEKAEE